MTQTTIRQPRTTRPELLDDEWQLDRLDIETYLRRIGYDGPLNATAEVLRSLHFAHASTIPFENLDIMLDRGVSLDMERLQEKLLSSVRGGHCYEHNLLFSALLESIGFDVRRLVARVQPDKPGPRTHMMLNVDIDGQIWLADVGFGAALLEPIPLTDGARVRQGAWTYGVRRRVDGTWALRDLTTGEGPNLYAFTHELQHRVDYVIANHFTSTHPSSPFVDRVVAMRTTPEERFSLRGQTLVTTRSDGASEERVIHPDDVGDVLREAFGIVLGTRELAYVRSRAVTR